MQQYAVMKVDDSGAIVPAEVLQALGASKGDTIAFVGNDDGSVSIVKENTDASPKRSVGEFAGIFADGQKRSLEDELALSREIRYGDELA